MKHNFELELAKVLDHVADGKVKEAALYALMNGGKRIRPMLLLTTLQAYRTSTEKGVQAACAVEMVHTYSLIHDDLPAMDNDSLRRGKPTCHIAYGEDIAILAGDALLTHSFSIAAQATQETLTNLKIVNELASSAGLNGMIYGQELDLRNEETIVKQVADLETTHFYKTGKLITLPFVLAAYIAKKEEDIDTWREIGKNLGILFQIQDDIFDVTKTSDELGKNALSDVDNNKATYVTLLGIDACQQLVQSLYDKTIVLLDSLLIDKEPLLVIFDELLNRNH